MQGARDCLTDENGVPNGIFTGNGCNIAKRLIPEFTLEERHEFMKDAMDYAVSTASPASRATMWAPPSWILPLPSVCCTRCTTMERGKVRYRHQVCFNNLEDFEEYLTQGEYAVGEYRRAPGLTLGPLKLFKDGSLGARTGLMSHGYVGDPETTAWSGSPWRIWTATASWQRSIICR